MGSSLPSSPLSLPPPWLSLARFPIRYSNLPRAVSTSKLAKSKPASVMEYGTIEEKKIPIPMAGVC